MTIDQSKLFTIPRGDVFPIYVYLRDANDAPITLVGKSIILIVKKKLNDPDETATILKTVSSHTNAALGQSLINLTPTDTEVTDSGLFQAEFQVVAGTDPTTFERAFFQFKQDVV